jgi:BASS family bile acid:Na+ symporter
MADWLDIALKGSLVIFMAGSLLHMGLGLKLEEALSGLRDLRFLGYTLLFGFVIGPALAVLLAWLLPLAEPYAVGLMLLGMTPCAPFLPQMLERAHGDMARAPAIMLLAAVGTIILLPLATPLIVPGLTVSAWEIAKPLIIVVLIPLVIGMAVHRGAPSVAERLRAPVKALAGIATLVMLVLCLVIYGRGFADAVGQLAIGAQALFFIILTAISYAGSRGLPQPARSAIGLGMCTRNVGAALAPLFSAAAIDDRAIVMVVLGVPMQIVFALLAAVWFAREASGAGKALE